MPWAVIFLTPRLGAMMSLEMSGGKALFMTMAQASCGLGLRPDQMFQDRAAHNGADQPRQALRTPR